MATSKNTKPSWEIRRSIFDKIGYSIEYQDLELDDDGDEIEDSDEGYYWVDNDGNRTDELFRDDDDAIENCLANVDLEAEIEGVKLSKAEKKYISEEYDIKL